MTGPNTLALMKCLDRLGEQHGSSVFDSETGVRLDIGQAICRGMYGVDWHNSDEFRVANELEDVPVESVLLAQQWIRDGLPEWATQRRKQWDVN